MKIYVGNNKILLVGKGWEIKRKLREYNEYHEYVHQWLNDCNTRTHTHKGKLF